MNDDRSLTSDPSDGVEPAAAATGSEPPPTGIERPAILLEAGVITIGHIQGGDGAVYDLSSITAVCTGDDGSTVNVAMTGSMKHKEYTGHVTLMK